MGHIDEEWFELFAPPGIAAHCQGTQGVAVIALAPRNEMAALRLADLDEVLARHLQRSLYRFRPATHEIHMAHALRRTVDQQLRQFLGHVCREEAGMGVGEFVDLLVHGRDHIGVTVPEARHRRASRCI
jgi:hypothetical protein